CVCNAAEKAPAACRVIARVLVEECRIQVLTKKGTGFFLNEHSFIQSGQAGCASGTEACQFGFAHYARVDASRSKCQRRACFIDEAAKFVRLSRRLCGRG